MSRTICSLWGKIRRISVKFVLIGHCVQIRCTYSQEQEYRHGQIAKNLRTRFYWPTIRIVRNFWHFNRINLCCRLYCGLRVRPCDYTKIPRITKKNCFRLLLLCSSLSYRWQKSMLYSSDITPFIWDTAMLFAIWIFTFRLARIVISIKIALLQRKHNLGLVNLCQDLILCWHAVSFPLA